MKSVVEQYLYEQEHRRKQEVRKNQILWERIVAKINKPEKKVIIGG